MTEDEIKTLLYIRGQGGKSHGLELPDITPSTGLPTFKVPLLEECFKQNNHGFTRGQIIYHNGTKYALATATSIATSGFLMVSDVLGVHNFCAAIAGHIKSLKTNLLPLTLVPGTTYYVSPTVAGKMVTTEPTISRPIFIADSDSSGWIVPYRPLDLSSLGSSAPITVTVPASSTTTLDTASAICIKWFLGVHDTPITMVRSETIVGTNIPSGAKYNEYSITGSKINCEFNVYRDMSGDLVLEVTNNELFSVTIKFTKEILT